MFTEILMNYGPNPKIASGFIIWFAAFGRPIPHYKEIALHPTDRNERASTFARPAFERNLIKPA
jgi:hypothetical protein